MCFLPSADFVLSKLQKEALEDGAFLVRWSAYKYDHIILAVLSRNEVLVATIAVKADVEYPRPLLMFLRASPKERINGESQAVSDPVQRLHVQPGRLGRRILHHKGAHGQPQEFRAQVRFRKLRGEKMLFSSTRRLVSEDFSISLGLVLLQDATLLWCLCACVGMQNCPT